MIQHIIRLFLPERCLSCRNALQAGETDLCLLCRHRLPETHMHKHNDPSVKKVFYGRLKLEQATALFYFEKKGTVRQLLHNLKYRGRTSISAFLGNWLGEDLAVLPAYQSIDVVIPVPVHPKKLKTRGYNQVAGFAKAIAHHLHCTCEEQVLAKKKNTKTQVFKGRFNRSDEVLDAFYLKNAQPIAHKHILLVDDVITTGATIEACALQLLKAPGVKISVAAMAIAR